MDKISVYYDPSALKELWSRTPFNLKRDLKNIDEQTIAKIAEDIGNEIKNGIERPPVAVTPYWGKKRRTAWAKIRTIDVARDSGKSSGYRCIVLVDYVNRSAFLLHLYRHGHGEDKDIDKRAKNMLKALVDEYTESLEEQSKGCPV